MKRYYYPLKWIVWALATIFYFCEFFVLVPPSVLIPKFMSAFSVNATAISTFIGFYFYYMHDPMQLPTGLSSNRYMTKKLIRVVAFLERLGSFFFSLADGFWLGYLGGFSERIRKKKSIFLLLCLLRGVLLNAVACVPYVSLPMLFFSFFLFGCASEAQGLNFHYSIDSNPLLGKGKIFAFINFIVIISATALQTLLGFLLDSEWKNKGLGSTHLSSIRYDYL